MATSDVVLSTSRDEGGNMSVPNTENEKATSSQTIEAPVHLDQVPTTTIAGSPPNPSVQIPNSSKQPVDTPELRATIVRQVEFYFSDANLPSDNFMRKQISKNVDGFLPVATIAGFKRMKQLSRYAN